MPTGEPKCEALRGYTGRVGRTRIEGAPKRLGSVPGLKLDPDNDCTRFAADRDKANRLAAIMVKPAAHIRERAGESGRADARFHNHAGT